MSVGQFELKFLHFSSNVIWDLTRGPIQKLENRKWRGPLLSRSGRS